MDAAPMTPAPAAHAPRKRRRRGRDADGRTREARRWRAVYADVAARTPLDPGSPLVADRLRSYATVTLAIEGVAARQMRGEPVDAGELVALNNAQSRLLAELGIVKRRKV